jgi:peptide/nickel transport system substrate-binding protein
MLLALSGTGYAEGSAGEKHLDLGISFCYSSIDAHKDYYGWMTSCYGVTEALFRIGDDLSLLPCVAESYASDGSVWTIKLRDNACFSNGEAVTPEMCIRNLQRVAEVNERFAYMAGYQYAVLDEHSFSIDTGELYPTLVNDLASPEFAILDLDNTTDFDNAIIATGPFVIDKFIPEGDVSVVRNENYYGGEVKLDSVKFFYMPEDEPKLFAMQNGEIQGYDSVTAGAYEVYKLNPELYQLTEAPGTRLQFYFLNKASLSDNLRAAINGIVDKENIAAYMKGTTTAAVGPFSANAAYGQVSVPKLTADEARALIEADGYTLGADGVYEKDGQTVDEMLDERYGDYFPNGSPDDYDPYVLGEDEYFVVGDNRYNSHDSRDWKDDDPDMDVGPIKKNMIVGHVRQVIWPLGSWRAVH